MNTAVPVMPLGHWFNEELQFASNGVSRVGNALFISPWGSDMNRKWSSVHSSAGTAETWPRGPRRESQRANISLPSRCGAPQLARSKPQIGARSECHGSTVNSHDSTRKVFHPNHPRRHLLPSSHYSSKSDIRLSTDVLARGVGEWVEPFAR